MGADHGADEARRLALTRCEEAVVLAHAGARLVGAVAIGDLVADDAAQADLRDGAGDEVERAVDGAAVRPGEAW